VAGRFDRAEMLKLLNETVGALKPGQAAKPAGRPPGGVRAGYIQLVVGMIDWKAGLPMKAKVVILILLTSIFALGIEGIGFIAYERVRVKEEMQRDLASLARIIADLRDGASTALVLQRALARSPELEDLKLLFLAGHERLSQEVLAARNVAMLRREVANPDLKSALSDLLVPDLSVLLPSAGDEAGGFGESIDGPAVAALPQGSSLGTYSEAAIGRRARVLLVEDNPVNMVVAQKLIAQMDLICESAGDGERALERMAAGNLDLVLMDCQMPIKDGFTATREWRQYESAQRLPRLPIIAMTANAMAGDRQSCLDAGMDDFIAKPVDPELLYATLLRWLEPGP